MNSAETLVEIARFFSVVSGVELIRIEYLNGTLYAEASNGKIADWSLAASRLSGRADDIADVVCYGEIRGSYPDMLEPVGLERLSVLLGFSDLHVKIAPELVPVQAMPHQRWEIQFRGEEGELSCYQVTASSLLHHLPRVPKLKVDQFDLTCRLNKVSIALFKKVAKDAAKNGVLRFWPMMNKRGKLYFSFDFLRPSNEAVRFEVAAGLSYCELRPFSYDAKQVIQVLNLVERAAFVELKFSNHGALMVEVGSYAGACYKYVLVGGRDLCSVRGPLQPAEAEYELERLHFEDSSMSSVGNP